MAGSLREKVGKPHCVAYIVVSLDQCDVYDGRRKFSMPAVKFSEVLATAVDRKLMVFFVVFPKKPAGEDYTALSELIGSHAS